MTPLVFLHGWGMACAVFEPLRALLSPHYDVRLVALPGYGATPACEPYTLSNLAAHVASTAPARCFVAGWSLGGQVALEWARQAPAQVCALALIGTTPSFVRRDGWTAAIEAHVLESFGRGLTGVRDPTLRRFAGLQAQGDAEMKTVLRVLRLALASETEAPTAVLQGGLNVLLDADLRDALGEIAQPVLVIHGERDALTPPAAGEFIAARVRNGRLQAIPGAAHAPFVTRGAAVAAAMQAFLR